MARYAQRMMIAGKLYPSGAGAHGALDSRYKHSGMTDYKDDGSAVIPRSKSLGMTE